MYKSPANPQTAKKLITETKSNALIEVDGGVDNFNFKKLIDCGTDVLVAGNYIFNSQNPHKNIDVLKGLII